MARSHAYRLTIEWTGNQGEGTSNYRSYKRSHTIHVNGKQDIAGSSDPSFRGEKDKHNPEELFLASIAACHMLWYLHLCAEAGITVLEYIDHAIGTMQQNTDGSGHFTEVTLHPTVTLTSREQETKALELHQDANKFCFIANSCNFEIRHQPTFCYT